MLSQNFCVVAVLALSLTALGQEQKDVRVETKVIGPGGNVQVIGPEGIEDIDLDLKDLDLGDAVGSIIFGVEGQTQDADEKGEARPRKRQDAGKDGRVVKEIDLGDGRKMRIVITTEVTGEGKGRSPAGAWMTAPEGKMRAFAMPHNVRPEGGDFKLFTSPEGAHIGPHGFQMGALGGEVKEQMERALRAFDKAREEFIRAYNEGQPSEPSKATPPRRLRIARTPAAPGEKREEHEEHDVIFERKAEAGGREGAALKEKIETSVNALKAKIEEEVKKAEADATKKRTHDFKLAEPKVVGAAPGASAKKEIDELRKEIKELEKMVRDLKKALEDKDE